MKADCLADRWVEEIEAGPVAWVRDILDAGQVWLQACEQRSIGLAGVQTEFAEGFSNGHFGFCPVAVEAREDGSVLFRVIEELAHVVGTERDVRMPFGCDEGPALADLLHAEPAGGLALHGCVAAVAVVGGFFGGESGASRKQEAKGDSHS